jgi:CheY-like chemotaxis protein
MESNSMIVVVDDDTIYHFTVEYIFKKTFPETKIVKCYNGREGLDMLLNVNPEVLFLDINMPIMDGWELLDELLKIKRKTDYPIFMVSSSIDPNDKKKAEKHPLKPVFIEKPLSVNKILSLNLKLG